MLLEVFNNLGQARRNTRTERIWRLIDRVVNANRDMHSPSRSRRLAVAEWTSGPPGRRPGKRSHGSGDRGPAARSPPGSQKRPDHQLLHAVQVIGVKKTRHIRGEGGGECQDGVAGPGVEVGRAKDCQVRKVGVSSADHRGGPPFLITRLGNRDRGVGADQRGGGGKGKDRGISTPCGSLPLQPCLGRRAKA
jgi:hypothetical protein